MGRRDGEGKRKSWMIEAGDWEKLYFALLKAKEKNIVLDVHLQRRKDVIELERQQRDRSLFNDIFEQKQLAFKYKRQKKKLKKRSPDDSQTKELQNTTEEPADTSIRDDSRVTRHLTIPVLTLQRPSITTNTMKGNKYSSHSREASPTKLMLPSVRDKEGRKSPHTHRGSFRKEHTTILSSREEKKHTNGLGTIKEETNLKRSNTLPNLYTIYDKSGQSPSTGDYWVGEPEAIGSVRRPRLNPDEMTDHTQPSGEARKLLIDLANPRLCSRQYTAKSAEINLPVIKPSIGHQTGTSYSIIKAINTVQIHNDPFKVKS